MACMQNSFITDAINLRAYSLSESDKIIVMYSKEKGLIKGVAKGVKKPKNKLGSRMDLFFANTLMMHKGRNLDTICQAETVNSFYGTRRDMDKIFYSMYVTEVVHNFGMEEDPSSEIIYKLLYDTLEYISKANNKIEILLYVIKFQLKMMNVSGFSLEFSKCLCCHRKIEDENMYFSMMLGGVICDSCVSNFQANIKQLHYKLRDFFQYMANSEFNERGVYEDKATEKVCLVTFNLLKEYVESKSAKKMKTSNILSEICNT